jgi:hypothetical protein
MRKVHKEEAQPENVRLLTRFEILTLRNSLAFILERDPDRNHLPVQVGTIGDHVVTFAIADWGWYTLGDER